MRGKPENVSIIAVLITDKVYCGFFKSEYVNKSALCRTVMS